VQFFNYGISILQLYDRDFWFFIFFKFIPNSTCFSGSVYSHTNQVDKWFCRLWNSIHLSTYDITSAKPLPDLY